MPRALLSVSDKTGIVDLARGLAARGFELVSTGGTARALSEAGLTVTSVSSVTGFPEMMDGRVKTLHPALHGGMLARRDHAADPAPPEEHGLALIDVVVVNLYPFVKAASNPATPFAALVEEIDIGGPSLVRAAAKNFRGVLVVVDPADYERLLEEIDRGPSLAFRFELMRTALSHTAAYDSAIASTLAGITIDDEGQFERPAPGPYSVFGARIDLSFQKVRDLRYGENPHQPAAWYVARGAKAFEAAGLGNASILQGKELSFTNLLDLDAAVRIVLEFSEPAAVVVKHTNPCGAAIGASTTEAYTRARDADSVAAYGGIVAVNRAIDVAAAQAIASTFIEAVITPSVDEAARPLLARRVNMRVLIADFDALREAATGLSGGDLRSTLVGILVQQPDAVVEAHAPWSSGALPEGLHVVTKRQPTASEWQALR